MTQVLDLIHGEPFPLLVTLLLFAWVGNWAIGADHRLRAWGWRLALVAFVAYVGYAVSVHGLGDPTLLASATFRGLLAGGLMLGASWISLSIVGFVVVSAHRAAAGRIRHRFSRRVQRQADLERNRSERERRLLAREREVAEVGARQEREQLALKQRQDQKHREDVRLRCQLLYDRHQSALASHFSRERLHEYFQTFLSDDKRPEDVEERARLLENLLQQTLDEAASQSARKFQSLQEIAVHFQARRDELERLGYPEDVKDSLDTSITEQEQRTIQEFMKP